MTGGTEWIKTCMHLLHPRAPSGCGNRADSWVPGPRLVEAPKYHGVHGWDVEVIPECRAGTLAAQWLPPESLGLHSSLDGSPQLRTNSLITSHGVPTISTHTLECSNPSIEHLRTIRLQNGPGWSVGHPARAKPPSLASRPSSVPCTCVSLCMCVLCLSLLLHASCLTRDI